LLFSGHRDPNYEGFERWLQEQVLPPDERNWRRVFLQRGMTEEEALAHFFALWEQYRSSRAEAVAAVPPVGAGVQSSPSANAVQTTDHRTVRDDRPAQKCALCGRQQGKVWRMIVGSGGAICSDCIETSIGMLTEGMQSSGKATFRVAMRRPDGAIERLEYGPLPEAQEWLDQCHDCGTWNVEAGLTACLQCGASLR
jgi:hypothetical protein